MDDPKGMAGVGVSVSGDRAVTARHVQWGVTLGVWWALLINELGNWAGQGHYAAYIPILWFITVVLALLHGAAWKDMQCIRQ